MGNIQHNIYSGGVYACDVGVPVGILTEIGLSLQLMKIGRKMKNKLT